MEVQNYAPEIAEKAVAEARAAFDPTVSMTASYREQNTPVINASSSTSAQTAQSSAASETGVSDALTNIRTLIQETQQILELAQSDQIDINTATTYDSTAKISQPLTTGTEIYVSGGFTQNNASNPDGTDSSGTWSIGINQPLLRGLGRDVNLVPVRQAENRTANSRLALRNYVLSLVAQVESAYWELALAQQTLEIRTFSLNLAEEQLKLNEAMIAVGSLPGSARVSAEAEVASQKAQYKDAEAALRTKSIELWQLLNPESQAPESFALMPINLPGQQEIAYAPEESIRLAKAFRPDLGQARLDVANGDLQVLQTKNGLLPRLDAFAAFGTSSSGVGAGAWNDYLDDTTYRQFEVGVTFSMTLGRRAEKARYQSAKLQTAQAEAALRNLEQAIESEVRKAIVEAQREMEQIAASRQEVLSREEELKIETEQFRLGRSTNLNVLQVQQNLVQAKLAEATAHVRYLEGITALYEAEGTLLTRRGVVLDEGK